MASLYMLKLTNVIQQQHQLSTACTPTAYNHVQFDAEEYSHFDISIGYFDGNSDADNYGMDEHVNEEVEKERERQGSKQTLLDLLKTYGMIQ